jgi:hypothetical protein
LVDEMLALQREHAAAQRVFDDAKESLARRIAAVDAALDREVYALYGLTEEEIALAEGKKRVASRKRLCYNCIGGSQNE